MYNIQTEAVAVDADGSDTEQQEVADADSLPDPNNEADSMDTEPQDKDEDNEADMVKDMDTDKVGVNEQVEAQPGTSGMSTRTRARKATDLPDILVPKRRRQGRPKKTLVKDTAKSVTGVQTPTTSTTPQVTPEKTPDKTPDKTPSRDKGASFVVEPRGPTPPPAGPPPPLPKKGTNTKQRKQTDPRVTLAELRALLDEPESADVDSVHVSTLDESPTPAFASKQSGKKKQPATAQVNVERCAVLKELGSAVKAYKQRVCTPPENPIAAKSVVYEDEISLWAAQCERKIRKITDPLLREDVMDHLSYIIKQASRGQWTVDNVKGPSFPVPLPTQQLCVMSPARNAPPTHTAPPTTTAQFIVPSASSSLPTANTQLIVPTASTSVQPIMHGTTTQLILPPTGLSDQQLSSAFTQWLHTATMTGSPSAPQGPQAQQVFPAASVRSLSADYTSLG